MAVADSMWVSVTNWFTPTVLFCILNFMVGTVFISSIFKHQKTQDDSEGMSTSTSSQFFRAPSLLERVRSINFSFNRSDRPYPFPPVDSHEDQEEHEDEKAYHVHSEETHHIMRSQSETSVEVFKSGVSKRKMKKSASEKIVTLDKENEEEAKVVDRRRPATVRERNDKWSQTTTKEEDEAVDEKADDFINRFRQQLKLQRVESILRYKEMLNRGAGSWKHEAGCDVNGGTENNFCR